MSEWKREREREREWENRVCIEKVKVPRWANLLLSSPSVSSLYFAASSFYSSLYHHYLLMILSQFWANFEKVKSSLLILYQSAYNTQVVLAIWLVWEIQSHMLPFCVKAKDKWRRIRSRRRISIKRKVSFKLILLPFNIIYIIHLDWFFVRQLTKKVKRWCTRCA